MDFSGLSDFFTSAKTDARRQAKAVDITFSAVRDYP